MNEYWLQKCLMFMLANIDNFFNFVFCLLFVCSSNLVLMSRIPFRRTCHAINFDYPVLMFEYLRTSQLVIMTKDIPTQISNLPIYLFEIREAGYYPFEDFTEKPIVGWVGGTCQKYYWTGSIINSMK